ncbi:hypothetical protein [Kitasatospora purpeofusca]|uniref:hypothetical protein n=1 Tax=Kitasatospora purpeofusca TaxID=67352 RepID=UPI00386D7BF1|nr:hypothetical protein OIP63_14565 [Kitasatospora purpeofusca]
MHTLSDKVNPGTEHTESFDKLRSEVKEIPQREFGETKAGQTGREDLISWEHERTKRPEGRCESRLKEVSVP